VTQAGVAAAILRERQDPGLGSTDLGVENQLEIEASTDDAKGKLRIGSRPSSLDQRRAWSLVMEAKVDKNDKSAVLGDLDGLSDDFAATYTHAFLFWKPALSNAVTELEQDYCRKDEKDQNKAFDETAICNQNALDGPNSAQYRREWTEIVYRAAPIRRLALSAKVGYSKFDYLDGVTFDDVSARELGFSVAGTYSVLTPSGAVPFAGLRLERSYKGADDIQLCVTGPIPDSLRCEAHALGAPAEQDRVVFFGEWRKFYRRFAVSPRVSYETKKSVAGIRIPFWFLTNEAGRFTGGMRLDWNNDSDDATVSVFVSTPLSLLTN
jgi:hypothetical protein